jgi:Rod binding domain-containing protein
MELPGTEMMTQMVRLQGSAANVPPPRDLAEASEKFEAIFLRQFLDKAMKPLLHDTPGSGMSGAGIYQYMMTDVLANSLSEQGQFGFSSLLQMQLANEAGDPDATGPEPHDVNTAKETP